MIPESHPTGPEPHASVVPYRTTLRRLGQIGLLVLVVLLVVSTSAAGADRSAPSSQLVLDLRADGSAELRLTEVYALDSPAEQAAFERLQSDPTVRAALLETFSTRIGRVAETAAAETDRSMRVSEPNLSLTTAAGNSVGIVTVALTWERLADVGSNRRLLVEEPLASGFTPDRPFVIELPADYAVESVTPEPTRQDDRRLAWAADTELTDFRLVTGPTSPSSGDPAVTGSPGQPGFGLLSALGVVFALLYVASTRHR